MDTIDELKKEFEELKKEVKEGKKEIDRLTSIALEKVKGSYYEGKYFYFHIFLDTPYKWGPGYGEATGEEIYANRMNFKKIFESLSNNGDVWLILEEKNSGSAPIWYNRDDQMEEIYAHPMELSGTLKIEKIFTLVNFIIQSDFDVTKFRDFKIYKEVKKYSDTEIYEIFEQKLPEVVKKLKPKGYVPCNYNFEDFGFLFKEGLFAETYYNKKLYAIKSFLTSVLNSKLGNN